MAAPEPFQRLLASWNRAIASPEWPEIYLAWLAAERELEWRHALRLARKLQCGNE